MPGYANPGFDTLALHAGAAPDPTTGARAVPIHLTTSFVFDSSEHAASLFNMERPGHVYSRISNPTNAVLEERVAALEGGSGAIATASGQAALHLAIATIAGAGSHIVASSALYGGSHNLLHYTLSRFGIATTFVAPGDVDAWRAAIRPETKLLFGETLGNPGLDVLDIPIIAALAHDRHLPLLVDSTFTTPWLMRPFEHGADLLYHSATKFLSGHGTVIGGVLVDSGRFDWDRATAATGRFAELTRAYEGFHGMVFSEESTVGAFLLRARREGLRDFGASMSPHTAWLILQGIETLPLRMARHVDNTRKVVAFLAGHDQVERVGYPELESHPDHALAKRLLPRGCGSVFSFDLRGSREQGRAFIEALKLFSHLANVGDCRSLVIHPASTTHFRMDDAALVRAGIGPGTIRLSIGLEDADDLIDDLKRALKVASKAGARVAYAYTGGKTFDPTQPCIVFLHGALSDHSVWTLAARWFAHHGYAVLAPDLPGHSRSLGPPLASVDALADWLVALLDAARVGRAALVGHSMGSLIALEAAARAPDRISHLVMVGTAYPMKVSAALLDSAQVDPMAAIDSVNAFSHATMASKPSYPGPGTWLHGADRALMRRVQAGCAEVNLFLNDFEICDRYAGGIDAAARVTCPVTLVLGASDQMTLPKQAASIAAALHARTVVLDGGHALMSEAPDGILSALRAALAETAPA